MNGLVPLLERLQGDPEPSVRGGHSEELAVCSRKRGFARTGPRWHLIQDPSLQNCEKFISMVYKLLSVWYFIIAA